MQPHVLKTCTVSICFFFLFASSLSILAQQNYASLEEALRSQSRLSGRSGPASVNWVEGGKQFSFIAAGNVIKSFDPQTQTEKIVFNPASVSFPGSTRAFEYQSFQWSADSKYLLFQSNYRPVWRNSGVADFYRFSVATNAMQLVAKDAYTAQLSPDGKRVAFERSGDLFVTDLATGNQTRLTNSGRDYFYNGRFGWAYEEEFGLVQGWEWSHDSRQIAFWQTDETKVPIYQYTDYTGQHETYHKIPYPRVGDPLPTVKIGVADVAIASVTWMDVACGNGYIPRIYWTSVPNQLAIAQLNRKQNHLQLYFANANTGQAAKVMEEKDSHWIELFSFHAQIMHYFYFPKNAKEFFWCSERDGRRHIYRFDYAGKLINQVTAGSWEVSKINYVDDEKKRIYYTSTEKSPLERHLYSIGFDGKEKKALTEIPGRHTINFSAGGGYFIDTYSNTTLPRQVDLVSQTGRLVKKLESNDEVKSFITQKRYAPLELQRITVPDGQVLDIGILKPDLESGKKYPVLLDVYGGPDAQSVYNQFNTEAWKQYLVQQGYVIVKVNNRGGSSYGAAFKKVVYEQLGKYECYDFAEVAKYMATLPWVDKDKIGIYGHSYGGFTASFSVLNYPDVYRCAIIGAPVVDFRLYDAIYTEQVMGLLPENKEKYDQSAVLSYVKNLQDKVLLVHSTSDDNVHITNSMQLMKAFIDHGKDAEVRLYQSGGHGVAYDFNSQLLLYKQYVQFLERNLK